MDTPSRATSLLSVNDCFSPRPCKLSIFVRAARNAALPGPTEPFTDRHRGFSDRSSLSGSAILESRQLLHRHFRCLDCLQTTYYILCRQCNFLFDMQPLRRYFHPVLPRSIIRFTAPRADPRGSQMPNNPRVSNLSRGFMLNFKQAKKAVQNCAAVWVEYGISIRDLTLVEAIAARAEQKQLRALETEEQARLREPLPYIEVPGLRYEPSTGSHEAHLRCRKLAWDAQVFVATQGNAA